MSKISLTPNASGTGNFTIASPNSNTDRTLTLPDNTGTIITTASTFAGTGPAFRVYQSTLQSISDNTFTKLTLNTEEFDTNSNYDTTNYRFTPTVAGYYFISGTIYFNSASSLYLTVAIFKNGSQDARGLQSANGAYVYGSTATALIYLNGSTDYVELYGYQNSGVSKNTEPGSAFTYFSGFLARSA